MRTLVRRNQTKTKRKQNRKRCPSSGRRVTVVGWLRDAMSASSVIVIVLVLIRSLGELHGGPRSRSSSRCRSCSASLARTGVETATARATTAQEARERAALAQAARAAPAASTPASAGQAAAEARATPDQAFSARRGPRISARRGRPAAARMASAQRSARPVRSDRAAPSASKPRIAALITGRRWRLRERR